MKKIFSLMLLSSALLSCKSSSGRSGLDAAGFSDGETTYLTSYNEATLRFSINRCISSEELKKVMAAGTDIAKAKSLCKTAVSSHSIDEMQAALVDQINTLAPDVLISSASTRLSSLTNQIADAQRYVAGIQDQLNVLSVASDSRNSLANTKKVAEESLANLQKMSDELKVALDNARQKKSVGMFTDIALEDTIHLAAEVDKVAGETAKTLLRMLANKDHIYSLDMSTNRLLVKAIQSFEPLCVNGVRNFIGEVDQGLERVSFDCDANGGLNLTKVLCPLAGYERLNNTCVFTGNGLSLASINASHSGICAITKGKAVTCWGKAGAFPLNHIATSSVKPGGGFGRMGDSSGTMGSSLNFGSTGTPIAQMLGNAVIGSDHAMCSLDSGNKINRCWPEMNAAPIATDAFSVVQGGYSHFCGLTSNRDVKCWGENTESQLSVPPEASSNISAISVGSQSTCALTAEGKVSCWGIHMGNRAQSLASSEDLPSMRKAIAVSNGTMHACAILDDNSLRCWGQNEAGQTNVPADLGGVRSVLASRYETCVITTAYDLRCWGKDPLSSVYKAAPPLKDVARLVAGDLGFNNCAITKAGKVACWGTGSYGDAYPYDLTPPADLGSVDELAITAIGYVCARMSSGGLSCWGKPNGVSLEIPTIFQN